MNKITCKCGKTILQTSLKRHETSKFHLNFIETENEKINASKSNSYYKNEIKNLNNTIKKKNEKIQELIFNKNNKIDELIFKIKFLKKENKLMKEDYLNYNKIKNFEKIKYELEKYIDTKNLKELKFFFLKKENKYFLRKLLNTDNDFLKKFNDLRYERNLLSHYN